MKCFLFAPAAASADVIFYLTFERERKVWKSSNLLIKIYRQDMHVKPLVYFCFICKAYEWSVERA